MRDPQRKIISLASAKFWRDELRKRKATLTVTNGCFDVFHAGHAELLYAARAAGDALLVLMNSDASVRGLKGDGRPVNPEAARAYVLAGMAAVDAVVVFPGLRCADELLELYPDVYAKSEEYRGAQDEGELAALSACGARTLWVPVRPGNSTTAILGKLGAAAPNPARGAGCSPNPSGRFGHREVPVTDKLFGEV